MGYTADGDADCGYYFVNSHGEFCYIPPPCWKIFRKGGFWYNEVNGEHAWVTDEDKARWFSSEAEASSKLPSLACDDVILVKVEPTAVKAKMDAMGGMDENWVHKDGVWKWRIPDPWWKKLWRLVSMLWGGGCES